MAITINASTSSGLVQTADTSGVIEVQNNGTTKLTVNSSGVNIGQYNAGTSLITSGTAVGASTAVVDFTSLPSWVKRVTVMFSGVSTNGSSALIVQLGTSSGFVTSGYVSGSETGTGSTSITTGLACARTGVSTASSTYYGFLEIVTLGSNVWVSSGNNWDASVCYTNAGGVTLGGTLTQVRITTVNGTDTFDAGLINILYE